jgi:hypothetical protein
MYLRVVRPLPDTLEGFDLKRFALLGGYEINPPLCDLLILWGYAVPDDAPQSTDRTRALKAAADAVVAPAVPFDPDAPRTPARRTKPRKR